MTKLVPLFQLKSLAIGDLFLTENHPRWIFRIDRYVYSNYNELIAIEATPFLVKERMESGLPDFYLFKTRELKNQPQERFDADTTVTLY